MNPLKFLRQLMGPGRTAGKIEERLADRIVLIGTQIDDTSATETIAKLLFLQDQNPESPITLYIDSPGGYVTAGLAILDTMDEITPQVHTVCVGHADAFAAQIVAHGTPGHRSALPAATFSVSPLWSTTVDDDPSKSDVQEQEIARLQTILIGILAHDTGQSEKTIRADIQAETGFSASEAQKYGLIDEIIERPRPIGRSCL